MRSQIRFSLLRSIFNREATKGVNSDFYPDLAFCQIFEKFIRTGKIIFLPISIRIYY